VDIHKAKPVHSWKELLSEIGVIVIGVLIALSAEQVVEQIHWATEVADLRNAMKVELRDGNGPQAFERMATLACLESRLDDIERAAEAGQSRDAVRALTAQYQASDKTWDMEAWRAFLASNASAHVSTREMNRWYDPYSAVPELQHFAEKERDEVADLRAIRFSPGPMAASELEALTRSVERLRADAQAMARYSDYYLQYLQSSGVPLAVEAKRGQLAALQHEYGACVVDPHRGPAPFSLFHGAMSQ
jgi:hypothetical protein